MRPTFASAATLVIAATLAGCQAAMPDIPAPPGAIAPADGAGAPASAVAVETPVDGARTYDLASLIDLAQRHNPDTRLAWERARQAAIAIGVPDSSYLPELSAQALAGYQSTPLPVPDSVAPRGYFRSDTREIVPSLVMKWLVLDFGRRDAARAEANEKARAARAGFTRANQTLAFQVSRAYFDYVSARGRERAAEHALAATRTDADAVSARVGRGLATTIDSAKSARAMAQARLVHARAEGRTRSAYTALLVAVGLAPTLRLQIGELPDPPATDDGAIDLARAVEAALDTRPDMAAALAKVRAAAASVRREEADRKPSVGVLAQVYQNVGGISNDGGPYQNINRPGGALLLQFSWPIFDGGLRSSRLGVAQSELAQERLHVEALRDEIARQVIDAHDAVATATAAYGAAQQFVATARIAREASLDAYRHGVANYVALSDDTNAQIQAEADLQDARAALLTARATLAFATAAIAAAASP